MKLVKGETVYTILRHVSRTGMFRIIDAYVIRDNEPISILAFLDSKTIKEYSYDNKRQGFRRRGAGMDMGFDLVYSISHAVFGDGYALNHRWI